MIKNIWKNFQNWIQGLEEHTPPYILQNENFFRDGTLADHLDVPTSYHMTETNLEVTADLYINKWICGANTTATNYPLIRSGVVPYLGRSFSGQCEELNSTLQSGYFIHNLRYSGSPLKITVDYPLTSLIISSFGTNWSSDDWEILIEDEWSYIYYVKDDKLIAYQECAYDDTDPDYPPMLKPRNFVSIESEEFKDCEVYLGVFCAPHDLDVVPAALSPTKVPFYFSPSLMTVQAAVSHQEQIPQ